MNNHSLTGNRDESVQTTMADSNYFRAVQRQQLDAMDSIQHHCKYRNDILQCIHFFSGYDQHDIHDNLYSLHLSSKLFTRQIRKYGC